jgi:hypothetical protein
MSTLVLLPRASSDAAMKGGAAGCAMARLSSDPPTRLRTSVNESYASISYDQLGYLQACWVPTPFPFDGTKDARLVEAFQGTRDDGTGAESALEMSCTLATKTRSEFRFQGYANMII